MRGSHPKSSGSSRRAAQASFAFLSFIAACGLSEARAADLRLKGTLPPPPPPAAVEDWTGPYVGATVGAAWNSNNGLRTSATPSQHDPCNGCETNDALLASSAPAMRGEVGLLGGGQIGYNYQIKNFVVGVEADITGVAGADAHGSTAGYYNYYSYNPLTNNYKDTGLPAGEGVVKSKKTIDYVGTLRARAGYLISPRLLLYGTGGLAYGEGRASVRSWQNYYGYGMIVNENGDCFCITYSNFAGGVASGSKFKVGWTVGGGAEYMIDPNWTAKVEYLYYDLGSAGFPGVVIDNSSQSPYMSTYSQGRFAGQSARFGLNYHFNDAPATVAPLLAKY